MALDDQNGTSQGFSSVFLTRDLHESDSFLSHQGGDCGLADANIGTSVAENGGAFGGVIDTGGGRETGSNAWQACMRPADLSHERVY